MDRAPNRAAFGGAVPPALRELTAMEQVEPDVELVSVMTNAS